MHSKLTSDSMHACTPVIQSSPLSFELRMAGEVIMSVAYGINVLPSNDPYITLAEKAVHGFAVATVPGVYLVVSLFSDADKPAVDFVRTQSQF